MNEAIKNIIGQYEKPKDFSHYKIKDEDVEKAESTLGVKLPKQYIEFLKMYGDGGIDGIEMFGVTVNGDFSLVDETLKYRKLGLPENFVVIENCDEWEYCIDCTTGHVVNWSPYDSDGVLEEAPDFDSFLLDELENTIANM